MNLDSLAEQVGIAFLGGIAAELLHWYALSHRPGKLPKYSTRPLYWATTAGMILFGALMPLLYLNGTASALLCFHLGAATPIILQKLVGNLPAIAANQGTGEASLSDFFRW